MAQDKEDTYRTDEKSTTETGSNLPHGDGTVSDEDTRKITEGKHLPKKPTGQDHSTENREDQMPTGGVGEVQDSSLIKENVAHIENEKGK
ncbi:MAG: hypothetical protein ACR2LT_08410 [Pyrinomonadaceae bacterium]